MKDVSGEKRDAIGRFAKSNTSGSAKATAVKRLAKNAVKAKQEAAMPSSEAFKAAELKKMGGNYSANQSRIFTTNVDGKSYFLKGVTDEGKAARETVTKKVADLMGFGEYFLPVATVKRQLPLVNPAINYNTLRLVQQRQGLTAANDWLKQQPKPGSPVVGHCVVNPLLRGKDLDTLGTASTKDHFTEEQALSLSLFDYAMGQNDRHLGNVFATKGGVKLIDNELCLKTRDTAFNPYSAFAAHIDPDESNSPAVRAKSLPRDTVDTIIKHQDAAVAIMEKHRIPRENINAFRDRVAVLREARDRNKLTYGTLLDQK